MHATTWIRVGSGAVLVLAVAAPSWSDSKPDPHAGSQDCTSCHRYPQALSHPVDVVPSMRVPSHLPLDGGRISCVTCHDLDTRTGDAWLRGTHGPVTGSLCEQCHDASVSRGNFHAIATDAAHLVGDDILIRPGGTDAESERCMSCHDGALASSGQVRHSRAGISLAARLFGGQHPIGVMQRPRGTGDTLIAASRIDPLVRLFDGRVGCGSCHSPYAQHENGLVISNERSQLCLACHDF